MKFFDYLKDNKDKKFIFVKANKGNWGDNLIELGSIRMANKLGIHYEQYNFLNNGVFKLEDKNTVIMVHGCGGLGEVYSYPALVLQDLTIHNPDNKIVIAPSTVMVHPQFLKNNLNLDKNFTFFAREQMSYDTMKHYLPSLNLEIDHCPSLFLTKEDFLEPRYKCNYNALFIREDKCEKIDELRMTDDFRKHYSLILDPVNAESFDEWVSLHINAKEILTNRCHSAILGSIFGIKTRMFRNNYHKNSSVWHYSLKDRGVEWQDL